MSSLSAADRARLILALAGARGWKLTSVTGAQGSTPAEVLGARWETATDRERDAFEVELGRVEADPSLAALLLAGPDEPGSVRMTPAWNSADTRRPQGGPGDPGGGGSPDGRARYEVRTEHARGGMGRVLVVVDHQVGREVAMKELLPKYAQGMAWDRERFLREARITGQLEHPNIVPVYEIGGAEGEATYYTMKLVRGETMEARLGRIRKSIGVTDRWRIQERLKLLDAFIDTCNAVAFAHARGVVNRDLKPANIMLGDFGETVVLDWGLARILGQEEPSAPVKTGPAPGGETRSGDTTRLTMDGDILGTPDYMAPEQARGEVESTDERSDVYALGVMLYEIIAGRTPFEGSSAFDILRAVIEETPKPADEVDPLAPRELAAVAAAAMERDRSRRLASARTLAEEVKAWRDGRAMALYRHTALEQIRRFVRHNRALALALGGGVLALVAGIAVSLGYARLASHRAAAEEKAHREAEARADEARRARLEAQESLRLAQGQRLAAHSINLLAENTTAALLVAIEAARRAPGTASTNALWTALCELLERQRYFGHEHSVVDGEFSPDGTRVATVGADFTAQIWDPATGEVVHRLEGHRGGLTRVRWREDGKRLLTVPGHPGDERVTAFQPRGTLDVAPRVWDAETGECLRVLRGHAGPVCGASWTPAGGVLSWSEDRTLRHWPADGDPVVLQAPWPVLFAAVSPDGRWIAAWTESAPEGSLWRLDAPADRLALEGHPTGLQSACFAADSRSVLTSGVEGKLIRRDLGTLAVLNETTILGPAADDPHGPRVEPQPVYSILAHPDGQRVAIHSRRGLHILAADLSRQIAHCRISHHILKAQHLDADWKRILIWDGAFAVSRDIATDRDLVWFRGHEYMLEFAHFSPDGRRVLTGGRDRSAIVWDAEPGACLPTYRWHTTRKQAVTSPDGTIALVEGPDGRLQTRDNLAGELLASHKFHGKFGWLTFTPDGRFYTSPSRDPGDLIIGTPMDGDRHRIPMGAHASWVRSSRNGAWLLATGDGGIFRIVETATGKAGPTLKLPPVTYDFGAVSDDGRAIALVESSKATVVVYDSSDLREICRVAGHTGWTISAAFGPDGTLYSSAMDASVRAWNSTTGEFLRTGRWPLIQETFVHLGQGGEILALDTGHTARFYATRTLDEIGAVPKSCASPVGFTRDDRFAAVRRAGAILHLPLDALAFAESVAPREMTPLEHRGIADSRADADAYSSEYARRHPRASTSILRARRALEAKNWSQALEHLAEARRLRTTDLEAPLLFARARSRQAENLDAADPARTAAMDEAIAAVGEAIDRGYRDAETLDADEALAPLRQDGRWAALAARARLKPWE